jgi:hypothetical protein
MKFSSLFVLCLTYSCSSVFLPFYLSLHLLLQFILFLVLLLISYCSPFPPYIPHFNSLAVLILLFSSSSQTPVSSRAYIHSFSFYILLVFFVPFCTRRPARHLQSFQVATTCHKSLTITPSELTQNERKVGRPCLYGRVCFLSETY